MRTVFPLFLWFVNKRIFTWMTNLVAVKTKKCLAYVITLWSVWSQSQHTSCNVHSHSGLFRVKNSTFLRHRTSDEVTKVPPLLFSKGLIYNLVAPKGSVYITSFCSWLADELIFILQMVMDLCWSICLLSPDLHHWHTIFYDGYSLSSIN